MGTTKLVNPRLIRLCVYAILKALPVQAPLWGRNIHARLTAQGEAKRRAGETLLAGVDYNVGTSGGSDWLPFPDNADTAKFRHEWVMVRRARPVVPVFSAAPMPKVAVESVRVVKVRA